MVLYFSPVQETRVHPDPDTSPAPKQAVYGIWPPTTTAVICVLPKRISRLFFSPFYCEKELENWAKCTPFASVQIERNH